MKKNNEIVNKLIEKAMSASHFSYSPYSKFKVGASIFSNNNYFIGANIENSSYSCTLCAESVAISNMIMSGNKKIELMCVVSDSSNIITPCGACRQRISEFSIKDTIIYNLNNNGNIIKELTIDELLPFKFGKDIIENKT